MASVATVTSAVIRFVRKWAPRLLRVLVIASVLLLGAVALIVITVLRRQGDVPPMGPAVGRLFGLALIALLGFALWWIPKRQRRGAGAEMTAHDGAELEDRFRRTLLGVMCVALVAMGLGTLGKAVSEYQVRETADRLIRATDQLSSDRMVSRVAGVHALAALASQSESMRAPAYETMQVFLRQRVAEEAGRDSLPPAADVLAAASAIARRPFDPGVGAMLRPNFSRANLRGVRLTDAQLDFANLSGAHLEGADLSGAHITGKGGGDLRGIHLDSARLVAAHLDGARITDGAVLAHANLKKADLDGALLNGADLRGARFDSAGLAGAVLKGAMLEKASLKGADLAGAVFTGAMLTGTDFEGALMQHARLMGTDLSAALHLTSQQIASAIMDETTVLPPGVSRPPALAPKGTPR